MSWLIPHWSESIKKRLCRYLLQRYLGQFLEEKLTLDQLTIDLYNGKCIVNDVSLDVQALNEVSTQQSLPFWFVEGSVSQVCVSVPWSSLLSDSSYVEICGLSLTVRPKHRVETGASMLESMWNSFSSSMQLAEECLKQDMEQDTAAPLEGLEMFAQMIESILSRIKVKFENLKLRLENVPKGSRTGVALEVHVNEMTYLDEAGLDTPAESEESEKYQISAFSTKKFSLEGISLYTDEFYLPSMETSVWEAQDETEHNLILAAKLSARQEIRLKMKASDNISGAKVTLEVLLGSLNCFLSPRQFQAMQELINGLLSPGDDQDKPTGRQKPMGVQDFQLVEQDLQQRLMPSEMAGPSGHLQPKQGWSVAEDSDEEGDEFFAMAKSKMKASMGASSCGTSSVGGGSMASSMTGSSLSVSPFTHKCLAASGFPEMGKKKSHYHVSEDEPWSADFTNFSIRISSLSIVLLQEDILITTPTAASPHLRQVTPTSQQQMVELANAFFKHIESAMPDGFGVKDFDNAKRIIRDATKPNHLRLVAAPITVEGTDNLGSNGSHTEGLFTAARLEFAELLNDQPNQDSELLVFQDSKAFSSYPDLQMSFSHKVKSNRGITYPRTEIKFKLQSCLVEVDLSLMDRISSVTSSSHPICQQTKKRQSPLENPINVFQAVEPSGCSDSRVDISVQFPNKVAFKLRFPCPDLRPLSDMGRAPWWQRNVRSEWLLIELSEAELKSTIDSRDPTTRVEVACRGLQVIFQDGVEENDVPVLVCDMDEAGQSLPNNGRDFGLIRLTVVISPSTSELSELVLTMEDSTEDSLGQSSLDSLERQTRTKDPSPFSAKRVVHESDTPHDVADESDELVIPGDKREITNFIEFASKQSKIHIDLVLPKAYLTIPSKHFYELLYNRITTDFMLWEPSRPSSAPAPDLMSEVTLNTTAFSMCKSGIHMETDSDSSSDSEGIFYSVHEHRQRQKLQYIKQTRVPLGQSKVTINLNINQGTISLSTPARDSANCVIPNQRGELKLAIGEGSLFVVSECRGDPTLSYVCIQSNQASLFHAGLVAAGLDDAPLLPTILQTVPGVNMKPQDKVGCGGQSLDMLCVAVKIHLKQPGALKMIKVATAVRGATLQHRVVPGPQSWLSQMIDMLDVMDYPVPGYLPPRVITELHLHLWNCAVDYRPLYLPLRCMVTMGSFSVSSNLAAQTRSSSLRFIAEEGSLFISDKVSLMKTPDLAKDYVSVITLGLFELSLRLSDDPRVPKVDLRASSTALHLRTCADSCRALAELLSYFASDGDLTQPINMSSRSTTPLQSERGSQSSLSTQSQTDQVNSMMEDAMQDSHTEEHHIEEDEEAKTPSATAEDLENTEEFSFPDDNNRPHVKPSSDDEEEFCILGEDPGTGIIPLHGEPEIRKLINGPIRIVENHFGVPLRRMDLLETPKNFPNPELRYTICDLSLVWHLYGGSDFQSSEKKIVRIKGETNVATNSPMRNMGPSPSISFSKSAPGEIQFNIEKSSNTQKVCSDWQERGGPGRDHNVLMEFQFNKVRFRHEVYPENAEVASRQVFLVQSLEARDRLATSAINKFLYLHCSESQPKQAHANMVVIKAVNLRPDVSLPNQQECCLKISLLPLRFNIDQDSLLFLCSFFSDLATVAPSQSSEDISAALQPPVMLVNCPASPTKVITEEQPLVPEFDSEDKGSPPIFFRTLLFSPDVPIRIDYQGKRVDMSHGPLAGILMGLAQLNCSEVSLKRLSYRHGLLGMDKLVSFMMSEWLSDIKKNQLPSVLGGVGPMHSIVQLFQGVRDLLLLPLEQYQRDGRIVRGLQRGAHSFTSSTAIAALELTNRLVNAVQITAETAYDMLSPGPSLRQRRMLGGTDKRRRDRQAPPADIREGVTNAYHLVQEGLGETARNLVAVASAEHEEKGVYGAVGGVLRQIPPTVVTPVLLASEATACVLGGLRSQLAPDARREAEHKWRTNKK
ncbi:autophagy-related protein 2 homolog A [Neocloeon triangulifer]|uniref:autophagy-related protein 2 homolog A n=1 Tax=Neocloeon triangulifer TaxID=2078957 RepID=UPI00286F5382|nr:autophagy-related protein 2 homolog A [Neocloeon triangulifer]